MTLLVNVDPLKVALRRVLSPGVSIPPVIAVLMYRPPEVVVVVPGPEPEVRPIIGEKALAKREEEEDGEDVLACSCDCDCDCCVE